MLNRIEELKFWTLPTEPPPPDPNVFSVDGAQWTTTQGIVQDTRVVPHSAYETKWGSQLIWIAEYRVVYSVGGREYSVWASSGIRDESKPDVELRLPQSRPACRVRYDVKKPESAVAYCP